MVIMASFIFFKCKNLKFKWNYNTTDIYHTFFRLLLTSLEVTFIFLFFL
jgi:hypothetical protein